MDEPTLLPRAYRGGEDPLFLLLPARSIAEAREAQAIDASHWPEGYAHYEALYAGGSTRGLLLVAVQADEVRGQDAGGHTHMPVAAHMGLERIARDQLGKGMPAWDHDPQGWARPDGNVWYITGIAVRQDPALGRLRLSGALLDYAKDAVRAHPHIGSLAVIYRAEHPTLVHGSGEGPLTRYTSPWWEKQGFSHVLGTIDPEWRASASAKDNGAVVYEWRAR